MKVVTVFTKSSLTLSHENYIKLKLKSFKSKPFTAVIFPYYIYIYIYIYIYNEFSFILFSSNLTSFELTKKTPDYIPNNSATLLRSANAT